MSLRLSLGGATLLRTDRAGASDVLPLLHACFVLAVRDLLALDHLAATLLCADHAGGQRGLAIAAPGQASAACHAGRVMGMQRGVTSGNNTAGGIERDDDGMC
jgi:hypothetical protein